MFATIINGVVVYLGNCREKAVSVGNDLAVKEVSSLEELSSMMNPKSTTKSADQELGDILTKLSQSLCGNAANKDFLDQLKSDSKNVVVEAKNLGARGIKTVGAGFIAIGDLLNKIEETENNKNSSN